ncbi:MAG: DnaJ domain-containing protein [Paludibacteraceae bacterium]|nr:DnaJ domain-containing protein [Paludibacteraceae bacterium]
MGYISLISIDGRDLDKYTPPAFLTERFFSNYMKKWGMTESEVEEYVRIYQKKEEAEQKRKRYLKDEKRLLSWPDPIHIFPIIHQICQMNLDAREAQEQFLKEIYSADKTKEVFETEFTDSQFNEAIIYWKKKDFSDKKMFVNYLYKLTILADGIHKDEWNFMISLMFQLRFSEIYIEYFAYRYYALRTDFEDSKSKHGEEGSSTTEKSNTNLDSYYSILGVSSDASYEEVRKAYHSLALTHHPDLPKNAGRIQECEDLMIKFNEAYNKIIKN